VVTEKAKAKYVDEIPNEVMSLLEKEGVKKEDILFFAKSDLNKDGYFCDNYAALTNENLYVIENNAIMAYPLTKDVKFNNENLIATGSIVLTRDGEDFPIISYTNTYMRKFGHLARLATKIVEGMPLSDDDFDIDLGEEFCPKCGSRLPRNNRLACPKCLNKKALFLRVLSYLPRYKFELFLVFLYIFLSSMISLVRPIVSGRYLYDEVLTPGGRFYGQIISIVLVLIVLEVASVSITILRGRNQAGLSAKIIYDIKLELFSAMSKLSMSFYNSKQTGSLMTRINNDALDIQYFLNYGVPDFVVNALTLVSITVIMFMFNPLLAIFVFLPVPLIVYMTRRVIPRFHKLKWATWVRNSRLNSLINDSLSGARVVKAFGKESSEINRFKQYNENLLQARLKEGYNGARTFPVFSYIMNIGGLFVWSFGGYSVISGIMTFGTLMTFIGYLGMIYGPIDYMVHTFDWYTNCMNSAQRIFDIIDRKSDVPESPNPVRMPNIKGDITLKNVYFAYEPNKNVLKNINLEIKAGQMIGLVGHSGAGKSTITNIITRLYDVDEGEVLIDGVNIKDIDLNDLRSQIGMVLQETFLFSGTIAENIAFARPDATREEIIKAAKLANAHEFIMRLPDGYDTVIGKRNTNLSGGERQRIAIARAILVNPKILILDEATASVDTETERQIQEALQNLIKGRTTIAIAHRLSTLKDADKIVVIEHGEIKEMGTQEELIKLDGIYNKMLNLQKEALKIKGEELL